LLLDPQRRVLECDDTSCSTRAESPEGVEEAVVVVAVDGRLDEHDVFQTDIGFETAGVSQSCWCCGRWSIYCLRRQRKPRVEDVHVRVP